MIDADEASGARVAAMAMTLEHGFDGEEEGSLLLTCTCTCTTLVLELALALERPRKEVDVAETRSDSRMMMDVL